MLNIKVPISNANRNNDNVEDLNKIADNNDLLNIDGSQRISDSMREHVETFSTSLADQILSSKAAETAADKENSFINSTKSNNKVNDTVSEFLYANLLSSFRVYSCDLALLHANHFIY